MKLPNRGFLLTKEGVVTWAWDWNTTDRDFDVLPPFILREDGSFASMATPEDVVVDLDGIGLESADVQDLVRNIDTARVELQRNGGFTVYRIMPDGGKIEHPIMAAIRYRKEKRNTK